MTELATDRALTVADNKQSAKLWIRLVKCHGLVLKAVRRRVGASDTTLPQFDVLAQLLRHPEGMTSTELSRALLVTAGNLTGIVDRLEARELVTRQAQSDDRRVRRLTLTGKGKRLARREVERHERWLGDIFEALPARDRERLIDALDELRDVLERNDPDSLQET